VICLPLGRMGRRWTSYHESVRYGQLIRNQLWRAPTLSILEERKEEIECFTGPMRLGVVEWVSMMRAEERKRREELEADSVTELDRAMDRMEREEGERSHVYKDSNRDVFKDFLSACVGLGEGRV
jgi:hypothetical protein